MGESVVPDVIPFAVDALGQTAEFFRLDSNQKKRSRDILTFQNIENLRGPLGIRTVVEGYGELVFAGAVARHTIGLGKALEGLAVDESGLLVDAQIALAVRRP